MSNTREWKEIISNGKMIELNALARRNPDALQAELIKYVPEYKSDRNVCDIKGSSFLIYAAYLDHHHLVKALIKNMGDDINFKTKDGSSALHAACEGGAGNAVNELLIGIGLNLIQTDIVNAAYNIAGTVRPEASFFLETNIHPVIEYKPGEFRISPNKEKKVIPSKDFILDIFKQYRDMQNTADLERKSNSSCCIIL